MPGIGVITNPKAKKNLRRPWIKESLQRIVGDAGWVYETRSIDELGPLAHELIEKNIDILAVNGGDGTTHIVLSHLIPIYQSKNKPLPRLLSLRGGTMNTISNSIKHKGKSENILSRVVRKYRAGEALDIVRQPVLQINDHYGFMWGCGVVGNFLEQYYKGTALGSWQAFKTVATIVSSAIFRTSLAKQVFQGYQTVVDFDERRMEIPGCRGLVICSIIEVGLGFKMAYRAYEKPGYMHVRGTSLKAYQFAPWIGHIWLGKPVPNEGVIDEIARKVCVKVEGKPPYTVDGELYKDTDEFNLRQGPVIDVIREGGKKKPKNIGLPENCENHAIAQEADSFDERDYDRGEIDRVGIDTITECAQVNGCG